MLISNHHVGHLKFIQYYTLIIPHKSWEKCIFQKPHQWLSIKYASTCKRQSKYMSVVLWIKYWNEATPFLLQYPTKLPQLSKAANSKGRKKFENVLITLLLNISCIRTGNKKKKPLIRPKEKMNNHFYKTLWKE